jgi:hypothetical protein
MLSDKSDKTLWLKWKQQSKTAKNMNKITLILIIILQCIELFSQDTHFNWEGTIREKSGKGVVPNTYVRVYSEGRVFRFVADGKGKVNINYYRPEQTDSVLVTSIGYKPCKLSCKELININEISIEEEIYSLNEVVIKPSKKKKPKTVNLGNTAFIVLTSLCAINFERQYGILIKYEEMQGQILKIRYRIDHEIGSKDMRYCPLRILIFDVDTINNRPGKNILNEDLIVSLNKGDNHNWLEVDVSQYNIELPPKGVFVGMETLSYEYYAANTALTSENAKEKYRFDHILNGFCIGITEAYNENYNNGTWYRTKGNKEWNWDRFDYLINIDVEKK